jgi:predicted RNase H-like HicB family nuclease
MSSSPPISSSIPKSGHEPVIRQNWRGYGLSDTYRFEDYDIKTGKLRYRPGYWASIEEFASLIADGQTEEEAIHKLHPKFEERVQFLQSRREPLPLPGSGKRVPTFAPNDQMEKVRPFVNDFWERIFGTSYSTSFVSNESTLEVWEQIYIPGGRQELIARVKAIYGVDITDYYDRPIPVVLRIISEKGGG